MARPFFAKQRIYYVETHAGQLAVCRRLFYLANGLWKNLFAAHDGASRDYACRQLEKLNYAWVAFFYCKRRRQSLCGFTTFLKIFGSISNFFGLLGLTLLFIIGQSFFLYRFIEKGRITMWYAIISQDVPDSLAKRQSVRPAHLERLNALKDAGRLLFAGSHPAIDSSTPGDAGFSGSLVVAEFASLSEAKAGPMPTLCGRRRLSASHSQTFS